MKGQRLTIKNADEVKARLKTEKEEKVKVKLIFLNLIADLKIDLEKACQIFGIAISTGYSWIKLWNSEGYEGIKGKDEKEEDQRNFLKKILKNLKDHSKRRSTGRRKK